MILGSGRVAWFANYANLLIMAIAVRSKIWSNSNFRGICEKICKSSCSQSQYRLIETC